MKRDTETLVLAALANEWGRLQSNGVEGNASAIEIPKRIDRDQRRHRDHGCGHSRQQSAVGDHGPEVSESTSQGSTRSDPAGCGAEGQRVFGVTGRLMESAGGYLVMCVLSADSEQDAIHKVSMNETRALEINVEFLGLRGTDELAHAEDAWAMRILNEHLFGGGAVAISRF